MLHKCDTPSCVRKGHLFLGTQADNVADMIRKGRLAVGTMRAAKLNDTKVRRIRELNANGVSNYRIGSEFGVSARTVWMIVHRRIWKHVK